MIEKSVNLVLLGLYRIFFTYLSPLFIPPFYPPFIPFLSPFYFPFIPLLSLFIPLLSPFYPLLSLFYPPFIHSYSHLSSFITSLPPLTFSPFFPFIPFPLFHPPCFPSLLPFLLFPFLPSHTFYPPSSLSSPDT